MATKLKKGDSDKEPKLHQGRMEKKTLGETRLSRGASSPLASERTVYDYDSGSIIGQKSDWIGTFRILSSSIWLKIGVIRISLLRISADGCRVDEFFTWESLSLLTLQGYVVVVSRLRSTI